MPMPPSAMDEAGRQALLRICREVLQPLILADGGELHLVALTESEIALHLSGACSGCPGASLTSTKVIEPALAAVAGGRKITVTAGAAIPEGATLFEDHPD